MQNQPASIQKSLYPNVYTPKIHPPIQFDVFIKQMWKDDTIKNTILWYQNTKHTTSMAILWCMWHDIHHSIRDKKTMMRITKIAKWYEDKYIIPIRTQRLHAKKGTTLYIRLLNMEIKSEMRLCYFMTKTLPAPVPLGEKCPSNVDVYLRYFYCRY